MTGTRRYKADFPGVGLSIDITTGINLFTKLSGMGKTYLVQLTRDILKRRLKEEVKLYPVDIASDYAELKNTLSSAPQGSLFILDRYDIHATTEIANLILDYEGVYTFLIDCKGIFALTGVHYVGCLVKEDGGLWVTDEDTIRGQLQDRFKCTLE